MSKMNENETLKAVLDTLIGIDREAVLEHVCWQLDVDMVLDHLFEFYFGQAIQHLLNYEKEIVDLLEDEGYTITR